MADPMYYGPMQGAAGTQSGPAPTDQSFYDWLHSSARKLADSETAAPLLRAPASVLANYIEPTEDRFTFLPLGSTKEGRVQVGVLPGIIPDTIDAFKRGWLGQADVASGDVSSGQAARQGAGDTLMTATSPLMGTTFGAAAGMIPRGAMGVGPTKMGQSARPALDELGFFSPSLEAAKRLPQERGTVEQMRSMLLKVGAKPKELEATGFDKAFPDPQAKVTRGEIEEFLRGNRVGLGETRFQGQIDEDLARSQELLMDEDLQAAGLAGRRQPERPTRFDTYSTPGGIPGSYREVVVTLPGPDRSTRQRFQAHFGRDLADGEPTLAQLNEMEAAQKARQYTSTHWPGITNPLLHYRVKDFITPTESTAPSLEKVTQPAETGRPYKVTAYHGTDANFDGPFDLTKGGSSGKGSYFGKGGVYLAPDALDAAGYGRYVKQVEAQLDNPLVMETTSHDMQLSEADVANIKARGHDGIILRILDKEGGRVNAKFDQEVFVLDPSKLRTIKTFDQTNPRNAADLQSAPRPQVWSGEGTTSGGAGRLPESNKVRVLDELQSDWAQRARDQGTRDPAIISELAKALEIKKSELNSIAREAAKEIGGSESHAWLKLNERSLTTSIDERGFFSPSLEAARRKDATLTALQRRWNDATNAEMDLRNKLSAAESVVPSAPFISSTSDWVDLGLKQALMDAVKDPSVSRFAWAPGKTQADRFGLHKVVDTIEFDKATPFDGAPDGVGRQIVMKNRSGVVGSGTIANDGTILNGYDALGDGKGKNLSEYIGKEWTDRLLAAKHGDEYDVAGVGIGGEGMKSFYGDFTKEGSYTPGIVGTRLLKLVKALDPEAVKIEATEVSNGVKYPSITITPKLREKLLNEGQSLFVGSPGPVVPGNDQNKAEADDDFNAWLDNEAQKFGVQR